ncbi:MAG: prepilin-type N-terminal cleavage/methylation domain-containing protein [Planctomycetota bacterium]|jgi:type II secretory pathway pseudopilin PulG|nr:prepilin-type N-terminal cleavage/methylation domain-containing protein [Planctomycetota bacterium]
MIRRGFTLVEMLVATLVFMFGFVAVYGMFLIGLRNRAISDATTRCATVAQSVIAEMRLQATNEAPTAGYLPEDYLGDGKPDDGGEGQQYSALGAADVFFAYGDQPGVFYRIAQANDLTGDPTGTGDGIQLMVLVGMLESNAATLSMDEIQRRFRLTGTTPLSAVIDELLRRGVIQRYDAVIHRQVAWNY